MRLRKCDSPNNVNHMKNLTVSIDEESYRAARMTAAERDTSVSELVRGYFRSLQTAEVHDPVAELFRIMDEEGSSAKAGNRERDRTQLHDR